MILFFEVEGVDVIAQQFFARFRAKLSQPFNLLSFPYSRTLLKQDGDFFAFALDIAWFPFYWFGLLGLIACLFFRLGFGWFILPGIMTLLFVFWSPWLYFILFKRGLVKAGFLGKVKKLSAEDYFWRVIYHGSD